MAARQPARASPELRKAPLSPRYPRNYTTPWGTTDLKAKAPQPKHSGFKAYRPGYIHIDVKYLPQMADESSRRYLFVAIDCATRWGFIRVFTAKTAANARRFLRDLARACPLRIRTILTDNVLCSEWTADLGIRSLSCRVLPARLIVARVQRVVNERSLP